MNDYQKKFEQLQEKSTFRGQQWFGQRKRLVEKYAWAVPNEEVLEYLANFENIIEIGAGSGYWAKCIEDKGGSVRAIDKDTYGKQWTEVEEMDVLSTSSFTFRQCLYDKVVMMVWPPSGDSLSYGVLKSNPQHFLYVGEEEGGCTGCGQFFDYLNENYGLIKKIDIPSYKGVEDNFYHYVRKN